MYRLLLICLCVCWQPGTAQPVTSYTFTHYDMTTGLVSNEIRSVVQDRTGYLWIASNNGLQRYDGVHYKTFQHRDGDANSLPVNPIWQLLLDDDDKLWVVTFDSQIGIFDKKNFTYTPVPVNVRHPLSLWANKWLWKDEAGHIFFLLHANELLAYDKQKNVFSPAASFIPLKPEWRVTALGQQPGTQKYWLALQSGGVAIFNKATGRLSYPGNNTEREAAVDSLAAYHGLSHFYFDATARLWSVTWEGGPFPIIVRFNPSGKNRKVNTYEFSSALKTYHEVHEFLQQQDGSFWVRGVMVFGKFNEAANRFDLIPNDSRSGLGIIYDQVTGMYEDREKNIWVATGNYGLYRFNPSQQFFTNVAHRNKLSNQTGSGAMMSFIELKNGDVLAGSWGDGLFRYNRQLKELPLNIADPVHHGWASVWAMCASADSNTIWMGCQPGIYQYNQSKGAMVYRNPPVLQNRTVRQLAEDQQGNLWLGMQSLGLYKWVSPKNTQRDSLVKIAEVGDDLVTKVVADNKGYIWVTTLKKGVFAFHSETGQVRFHWNNRSEKDSLKIIEGFNCVIPYNDSLVYIATATRLYKFNRQTNSLTQQHLPGSLLGSIEVMEKDDAGLLWIGTDNGLYRYSPNTGTMIFFNRQDGIANDRFVLGSSYRLKDGRILLGTDNAFIYYHPAQIRFPAHEKKIVFTSIQAGQRELPVDSVMALDVLTLGSTENSLAVDFSSLSFADNAPIQYKLKGIDAFWHTADKDKKASFPFLPPGRYTLLLRTITAEGKPSEETSLKLYVLAPFYQTWWFYTLLAVLTASLLFWLDRQRMKRKEAMQKVRTDIAGGLHQEVNTALNNINILSEIARLKSEREPAKARDYLEQIHNKSHNMIIALDDMLWSLDPENDAMDKTIQRIKEYADALTQRNGTVIELLIDKKVERLHLNMKLRHEAFLLFKEGLRSLIDAGTRNCIVHLTAERGKLLFTIEFENEHCNMQKLNNLLQRRDMEERINDLNAKLDVQVHKSRSIFMLQLPLQ